MMGVSVSSLRQAYQSNVCTLTRYNINRTQMQTLSLQLVAPLSQKNALAIMREFSPKGMAIK